MLKAGEYSPNNPLARTDHGHAGDALLGLGEYERRSDALRKLRQREYREYLLQQAKKKQEAKEREIREQREREQFERQRAAELLERDNSIRRVERVREIDIGRRDTGVQAASGTNSVGVQTDDEIGLRLSPQPSPTLSQKTRAERELSPRTVGESDMAIERRKSNGEHNEAERSNDQKCKDRHMSELRHSYRPSILDAEAVQMRNMKAEQEAAAKRQSYQQELKNQIQEQQRIREERKAREKLLEQAESRRLQEQLRLLQDAQRREAGSRQAIITAMAENSRDYNKKRTTLQQDIETEKQNLYRSFSQNASKLKPFTKLCEPKLSDRLTQSTIEKKTFSTNIPQNSLFSSQYDVDSYLRRNLNPKRGSILSDIKSSEINSEKHSFSTENTTNSQIADAEIHVPDRFKTDTSNYEPSFLRKDVNDLIKNVDDTPIPVLRYPVSPKINILTEEKSDSSNAMKKVEDKWKVPIVQKNILKTLPSQGKNVSILTQLGSIRRQLQLEQLRLDKKLYNEEFS